MISLSTLAKTIEDALNEQGKTTGFEFKIATETGDFKKALRDYNDVHRYVNGVLEAGPSSVTDLTSTGGAGLLYATQTCYLRLVVKLEDEENDTRFGDTIVEGYQSRLESLRNTLNSVFEHNALEPMEDGDRNYSVSIIYSFEQTGTREPLPVIGDCMSFRADVYFMFVENGVNARDVKVKLDGVPIPFQSITTFRTPTMDGNVYANTKDGSTKNLISQTTFSATIELPAITDETTKSIVNYLLKGNTDTHMLTYVENDVVKESLVVFGEVKQSGETIKNVGQTLTFMESPEDYDLISFPDSLYIYQSKMLLDETQPALLDLLVQEYGWKFGDTVEPIKEGITVNIGDYIVTPFKVDDRLLLGALEQV